MGLNWEEGDFPAANQVAHMKLGLALESGYFKVSDGYTPGYGGWSSEDREILFTVRNTNIHAEEYMLTAQVPHSPVHLYTASTYHNLRNELLRGGKLDADTIRRKLELSYFNPIVFLCVANQWFSELGYEASAATTRAPKELPMAADNVVALGRSHVAGLSAPVFTAPMRGAKL